jgi:hypothetical protein
MKYGDAVRAVRRNVSDGIAEVIDSTRPKVRLTKRNIVSARKAAIDGLVDGLVTEIIIASRPGQASRLGEMVALQVMCELERRTSAGSA